MCKRLKTSLDIIHQVVLKWYIYYDFIPSCHLLKNAFKNKTHLINTNVESGKYVYGKTKQEKKSDLRGSFRLTLPYMIGSGPERQMLLDKN